MIEGNFLEQAQQSAEVSHRNVEQAIARTPTSKTRNMLTDANMHLMLAIQALERAKEMEATKK